MENINELIERNKGLVYKQLHRFHLIDDPDAESAGFWALCTAIKTFDKSKNVMLSTYATCCIYNALGCHVRTLNKKSNIKAISYETSTAEDCTLLGLLTTGETAEDVILRSELVDKTREAINRVIQKSNNDRHREIMTVYMNNDFEITTQRIADEVGVSQSYVSQVLSTFRNKIKKEMESYYNA